MRNPSRTWSEWKRSNTSETRNSRRWRGAPLGGALGGALLAAGLAAALLPAAGRAAVPISGWGFIITQSDTDYELAGDLVEPAGTQGTSGSVAIFVLPSVHDVVIDGGGFTIDGRDVLGTPDADIGIRIIGLEGGAVSNLEVRDVRFRDLTTGLDATDDLCNVLVENCEFSGCQGEVQISFATTTAGATMRWITVRDSWIHACSGVPIRLANLGNAGAGAAAEMSHVSVVANVLDDDRQSLAAPATWNAAIVCRHGATDLRIWDNVVMNGAGLAGLFVGSGDEAGEVYDGVSVRGNHFGGQTGVVEVPGTTLASGMTLDRVTTTSGDFASWTVSGNYFYLNEGAGIELIPGGNGPATLPADGNWWGEDGTVAGTYGNGAVNATDAAPRDLPDGVLALPDRGAGDRALSDTDGFLAQVVLLNQNDAPPGIRGFDVDYDFAAHLLSARGNEGPFLSRQAPLTQFYDIPRVGGTGNERTASGAILGGTSGAAGNGALCFTVLRAGPEELAPADDFFLDAVELRDPDNFPLGVAGTLDADRRIDDTDPVIFLLAPGGNPCVSADTAWVEVSVTDNFALEDVYARSFSATPCADCWTPLSLDEAGTDYSGPNPVPVDLHCCEGEYTFEICATDDAGNRSLERLTLVHDTTPPPDFAGTLTATTGEGYGTPALDEIEISWNGSFEAGGDLKLRYLPYGGSPGFYAYPEYDDEPGVDPHFPQAGEGTEVDIPDVSAGSVVLAFPIPERSYYYFTILVEDCAGNPSPGTSPATHAEALDYFLGDWDSNLPPVCAGSPEFDSGSGTIDFCDLVGLSLTFATGEGHPDYFPEADIGPTVPGPGPRDGIPLTDNVIDFEDLILFAINFGSVSPRAGNVALAASAGEPAGAGAVRLELGAATATAGGAGERWQLPLFLRGNVASVKGFEAVVAFDPGAFTFAGAEPWTQLGPDIFFAPVPGKAGTVAIDLAVLGGERVIEGSGMVAVLELERRSSGAGRGAGESGDGSAPLVRLAAQTLRDAANRELRGRADPANGGGAGQGLAAVAPAADAASGMAALVTRLAEPVPNPFNPATTLRFALAAPGPLTLRVFDPAGRVVRELWRGLTPAGERQVAWDGRGEGGAPVPSGIYFVEMHAGAFRAVQKVMLLK